MLIRLLNDHLWLAVFTDRGTDTRTRGAERPEVLVGINDSHHSVPLLAAGKGPGVHKVHGPDVLVAAVHNGLTGHRQRSMLYYVCGTSGVHNFIQFGRISYNSKIVQFRTKLVQLCTIRVSVSYGFWTVSAIFQWDHNHQTHTKFIAKYISIPANCWYITAGWENLNPYADFLQVTSLFALQLNSLGYDVWS